MGIKSHCNCSWNPVVWVRSIDKKEYTYYAPGMLLAINTCLRRVEVVLIDDAQDIPMVVGERSELSNRDHAEKIFEFLDELLKKSNGRGVNTEGNDEKIIPDKVLVVRGPGPFTSIRVGVVTANTIAYASRADLYGVTLHDIYAVEEQDYPLFVSGGKSELFEMKGREEFQKHDAEEYINQVNGEFFADFAHNHMDLLHKLGKEDLLQKRKLSFGQAVKKIIEQKLYTVGEVSQGLKPLYLKPPNISKSNKAL